jgi:hypothetical protein
VGYPVFVVVVVNGERPLSGIWTLFSFREKEKSVVVARLVF